MSAFPVPEQVDMLLLSVPYSEMSYPPCGPAVLKGIAESHGYIVLTRDLAVDFDQFMNQYPDVDRVEVMSTWVTAFDQSHRYYALIQDFYKHCVREISKVRCRYLGLSVFSGHQHRFTFDLCELIKHTAHEYRVVLGGKGCSVHHNVAIKNLIRPTEKYLEFYQIMQRRQLTDQVVIGDAEDAIVDLLSGDLAATDTSRKTPKVTDLSYPFSNFDDYDFDFYGNAEIGFRQLPVVSSKGCVRSCDFCDVGAHFVKFQSKNGVRLAEEMIYLRNKYNVFSFALQDSIANGNMKSLREMCNHLAEYNKDKSKEQRIRWAGNWIARPPGNIKPAFFDLLAASGCESLVIGAESGSNRVLEFMQKKTTVEGLFYELEQMDRCGIQVQVNTIVGHWSELYEDFVDSVDMILKLAQYHAKGTVTGLISNSGFMVLENTPASRYQYSGIHKETGDWVMLWYSDKNPGFTARARFARLYATWKIYKLLHISAFNANETLTPVIEGMIDLRDQWQDFYRPLLAPDHQPCAQSVALLNQVDAFLQQRLQVLFPSTMVSVTLKASACNGDPRFYIKYNDLVLYENTLSAGTHTIAVPLTYDYNTQDHCLQFGMNNKQSGQDTEVDAQGNIVADKRIIIESLIIDGIDIVKNVDLYYKHSEYCDQGQIQPIAAPGFYSNASIAWRFQAPFWRKVLEHRADVFSHEYGAQRTDGLLEQMRAEIDRLQY